jgi:hypothetical protein
MNVHVIKFSPAISRVNVESPEKIENIMCRESIKSYIMNVYIHFILIVIRSNFNILKCVKRK